MSDATTVAEVPPTIPFEVRKVAGILGRRGLAEGRYADETPNAFEWAAMEASDVYEAIHAGHDPAEILDCELGGSGWWSSANEGPFPDDLRRALVIAAREVIA